MSAQAIGRELAKIAVNLEETGGQGFDRYFGAFVLAARYLTGVTENGTEYSTHMAFDAEVAKLVDNQGQEVAFRYALRLPDGSDAGEAEYAQEVRVGDELRVSGNRRVRVTALVPLERIGEFVDDAVYGVIEIEPLQARIAAISAARRLAAARASR